MPLPASLLNGSPGVLAHVSVAVDVCVQPWLLRLRILVGQWKSTTLNVKRCPMEQVQDIVNSIRSVRKRSSKAQHELSRRLMSLTRERVCA